MFGMPNNPTPLQLLWLDVHTEIGRAIQTHTAVEAALIAAGNPGPWEYYLMLAAGDSRLAARLQAAAMLNQMMGGR